MDFDYYSGKDLTYPVKPKRPTLAVNHTSVAASRQVSNVRVYEADWDAHKKAAGPIRNKKMLTESQPHVIIAFKGGNGTAHMIKISKEAGVPVYEVKE